MHDDHSDELTDKYLKLAAEILALKNSNIALPDLIKHLNFLIIENGVADKQIAWTPEASDIATWNIACGGRWVNVTNKEGVMSPDDNIPNPTGHDPKAHDARMACCAAILSVLKKKGIDIVALQEAPGKGNDRLYGFKENNKVIITKNDLPKPPANHIRTAIFGLTKNPNSSERNTIDSIKKLAEQLKISSSEYQIIVSAKGKIIVDVHLDYVPPGKLGIKDPGFPVFRDARLKFIEEINKLGLTVLGDTNRTENDIVDYLTDPARLSKGTKKEDTTQGLNTYGTSGGNTVDAIFVPGNKQPYVHYSPTETREQIKFPDFFAELEQTVTNLSAKFKNMVQKVYEEIDNSFVKPASAYVENSMFPPSKTKAIDNRVEREQLAQQISQQFNHEKSLNSSSLKPELVVNKGEEKGTFKIAFKDIELAKKFFNHAKTQQVNNITFSKNNEINPLNGRGEIDKKNGEYKYIVRFYDNTEALSYLKNLNITEADRLFNSVMGITPTAKLSI